MQNKYLIWSATVALAVLAVFLLVSINYVANSAATSNTVTFTGEGKATATPDVAVADVSIVTEAATSKAAQDANTKKSKQVVDFLKNQGIEEKDIKTTGYNLYPQYNYPQFEKPAINGYTLNQSLQVKIRDLGKVSAILDGIVANGTNQVNNLSFQVDDPEKLKADVRAKAIADAKQKADTLENQIGIHLGKIVNFSENFDGGPVPIYIRDATGSFGGGGPTVPTGQNEIIINVSITYQIK